MFNGIIQNIGIIEEYNHNNQEVKIKTKLNLNDSVIGSSISCDGVCLTLINILEIKNFFYFFVNISEETNSVSTLKYWKKDHKVNLEKSMKNNQEISGHFVYGHVDYISELLKIDQLKNSWYMYFNHPSNNKRKFIVEKGSIAINGISFTISKVLETCFSVAVIPHTYNQTNLSSLKINDKVNIEFDMLARYIFNK